jgi:hypothetical protein
VHFSVCQQLIQLLGSKNIRQVNQQKAKDQFPKPAGYLIKGFSCFDYPAFHLAYTVQSDYALAIHDTYTQYLPASETDSSTSTPPQ